MTGIIDLKIRVRLELDLDKEDAQEFVENLGYKITSPEGKPAIISDTEIVAAYDGEGELIGME